MNTSALRGAVYGRYKSQAALSDALMWNKSKVSKLLQGAYLPDVNEAARLCELLELSTEEYSEIFLG